MVSDIHACKQSALKHCQTMIVMRKYLLVCLLSTCCLVILLTACSTPDTPTLSAATIPAIPEGAALSIYHGHLNAVSAVAWSPDGKRIASASYDNTIQVWDAATGHPFFIYRGQTNWITAVAWSPDGKRLASASFDRTVQVHGLQMGAFSLPPAMTRRCKSGMPARGILSSPTVGISIGL